MASIENRVIRLERSLQPGQSYLEPLLAHPAWTDDQEYLALDEEERRFLAFWLLDEIVAPARTPFVLERLRGHVPDTLLRDVYLFTQSGHWPREVLNGGRTQIGKPRMTHEIDADVLREIHRRAGVIDVSGDVVAGYVRLPNGRIVSTDDHEPVVPTS